MQNVLVSYPGTISLKIKIKIFYSRGKEEGGRGKGWEARGDVVEVGEEEEEERVEEVTEEREGE